VLQIHRRRRGFERIRRKNRDPSGKVFFWEREYPMFLKTIPEGASLECWEERGRNMTIR
jgi:hypothetical protein